VELVSEGAASDASGETLVGRAVIRAPHEKTGTAYRWRWRPPTADKSPGAPFTNLLDSAIHVFPVGAATEAQSRGESRKAVKELSRPMRDYLLAVCLRNREKRLSPELSAIAASALSLLGPWQEAQHDVPGSEYWAGFVPYILLEAMQSGDMPDARLDQLHKLFSLHLTERPKALARKLAEEALLASLPPMGASPKQEAGLPSDAVLAEWVRRARLLLPEAYFWTAQNRLWDLGLSKYPKLARELGFS
jgi:hypothetical protein